MDSTFTKNLSFLKNNDPDLAYRLKYMRKNSTFSYVKNPAPNIYYNKHPYHSIREPYKEAQILVGDHPIKKGTVILFLGVGLGYHIREFMRRYRKILDFITIIAVERYTESLYLLMHHEDISYLADVKLFIGAPLDAITSYFSRIDPLSFNGYRIIPLRGAVSNSRKYYNAVQETFTKVISSKLSDTLTRFAFETLWINNVIENISYLIQRRPINALKKSLEGYPALVIGAGPSLRTQLDHIKEISSSFIIFAVDTVLEPLLLYTIVPDFVITLDAQFHNALDFSTLFRQQHNHPASRRPTIIYDIVTYPKIAKYWKGPLYFTNSRFLSTAFNTTHFTEHTFTTELKNILFHFDGLPCGGSVITTAIEFARYTGAYPLYITGMDFSYTDYMTHINSSPSYNFEFRQSTRIHPLISQMTHTIANRRLKRVIGLDGDYVLSDYVFNSYRLWIESRKVFKNKIYNCTKRGAMIANLQAVSLDDIAIPQAKNKESLSFSQQSTRRLTKKEAIYLLVTLQRQIEEAAKECHTSPHVCIQEAPEKYPFLFPVLYEAQRLYKDRLLLTQYIERLLHYLRKKLVTTITTIERK